MFPSFQFKAPRASSTIQDIGAGALGDGIGGGAGQRPIRILAQNATNLLKVTSNFVSGPESYKTKDVFRVIRNGNESYSFQFIPNRMERGLSITVDGNGTNFTSLGSSLLIASTDFSTNLISFGLSQAMRLGHDVHWANSLTLGSDGTATTRDYAMPRLSIIGYTAYAASSTNLVGGDVFITGGSGAASSAGLANGGQIVLSGGLGYGTGKTGAIELRSGTVAQTLNIYNTYTDASNYERGFMRWNTNVLEIGTEALGTGSSRAVRVTTGKIQFQDANGWIERLAGTNTMTFAPSGNVGVLSLAASWVKLTTKLALGNESTGGASSTMYIEGTARGGNTGEGIHVTVRGGIGSTAATGSVGGTLSIVGGAAGSVANNDGGDVLIAGGAGYGTGRTGYVKMTSLPTSDPLVTGALWSSSNAVVLSGYTGGSGGSSGPSPSTQNMSVSFYGGF